MKKTVKLPLIILSAVIAAVLIAAAVIGIVYINADAVRFDYIDCDYVAMPKLNDASTVNYPFFGNSLIINKEEGRIYSPFLGSAGQKNLDVYDAVNVPVCAYVEYLAGRKYSAEINLDYTVEQDGSTLTVQLNGTGTDVSGTNVPIKENLVFNIENADPENLPVWVNGNETDEEFKEYWNYLNNTGDAPMPDWYAEQLGI